mgnify:CR=1
MKIKIWIICSLANFADWVESATKAANFWAGEGLEILWTLYNFLVRRWKVK